MANVKLFGRTYTLPAVGNERFCRLQQRVNKQYRLIQEGVSYKPRRLSRGSLSSAPPSPEERFQELSRLIRNYRKLIAELHRSQEAYQHFFAGLAAGVRQALGAKRAEIHSIEQERLRSYQDAVTRQDNTLRQLALEDEELLLQGVRLLGQAALLLLKKIAVCQECLTRLAEDQELQRQVLIELVGHLDRHRQAYERRRRIDKVVREVAEMAEIALEFEGYMCKHLGPLQDLLDHVVKIDTALHHAVIDIEDITRQMLQHGALLSSDTVAPELTLFETQVLAFLTAGQLKQERLSEVWRRIERQDGADLDVELSLVSDGPAEHPVADALDNIERLVDLRLTPLISNEKRVTPIHLPTPDHLLTGAAGHGDVKSTKALWRALAMTATTTARQFSATILRSAKGLNLELVLIPAGTFQMGSMVFNDEQPIHEVRISQPFYLGKYPVMQAQWEAVMGTNNSYFTGHPRRPVESVSWEEVQAFIRKLNDIEGHGKYRLPTEAEWEYAARANSTATYCFGDEANQLSKYAWYEANSGGQTHPVGRLKPNAWGVYDMHGNVWEWIQDWYGETHYEQCPYQDPQGPPTAVYRVVRGGGWDCYLGDCRSASRNVELPNGQHKALGFRLLRRL